MANYATHLKTTQQPQTVKDRDDQVQNHAGGFVYQLDDWKRLDRFLIIGSEGGSFYVGEKEATVENAKHVRKLLNDKDAAVGRRVIDRVVEISDGGRAPKNDPALLVLALGLSSTNDDVRRYASEAVPKVARIATHLFTLVDYTNQLRRWGRGLRKAVANWYNGQPAHKLAVQVCKYQSRTKEGSQTWSHVDVLRKAHVKPITPAHNAVMKYVTAGWTSDQLAAFRPAKDNPFNYIAGHELAKKAASADQIVKLIDEYGLMRESIPTQFLKDKKVWDKLLDGMPMTAMIRNLATMTRVGTLGPLSGGNAIVAEALRDRDALKKARVHPIQILAALKTYQAGRSFKGDNTWTPVQSVVDALDEAFYLSFDNVVPTGKRLLLGVDCSGSMSSPMMGSLPFLSARDVAASLALVTAKTESNYLITGFTNRSGGMWGSGMNFGHYGSRGAANEGIQELGISPRMRLDTVADTMARFPWGGTDCALPMLYAKEKKLRVDAFVVITDNETWAGNVKADEALRQYRASSGISDAALVVIGCTASAFTIADPNDSRMLDVAGMDTSTPQIIADFIRGDL